VSFEVVLSRSAARYVARIERIGTQSRFIPNALVQPGKLSAHEQDEG
jgi:hypothetical protein